MFAAGAGARIGTNYGPLVKSDTPLPDEIAGVWVGGAGNVALIKRDGTHVVFAGVPAGTFLPLTCMGVGAESTATLMCWVI